MNEDLPKDGSTNQLFDGETADTFSALAGGILVFLLLELALFGLASIPGPDKWHTGVPPALTIWCVLVMCPGAVFTLPICMWLSVLLSKPSNRKGGEK